MRSCTTRSMTTVGWRIQSCSPMSAREPRQDFGDAPNTFFADHGILVKQVLTDNGSCYRSKDFAEALGPDIKHRKTRPYRPQTNGKVERFNCTLTAE